MIVIIDYGMGNLKSVYNSLKSIHCPVVISSDIDVIRNSTALILPGVGAFNECMDRLERLNLVEIIKEEVAKGKYLLGICLGMQVLFEKGYEGEERAGLALIKGKVVKMIDDKLKIPHIGWNDIKGNRTDSILNNVNDNSYVYFVHSYFGTNYNDDDLVCYSNYGEFKIPAIIRRNNVIGAQFHPEKSGEVGLQILKNFKELVL